jgi:hypothetical protein
MKYYAGVGSREVPQDILDRMTNAAETLEILGFTLRSGGAKGADSAFERGATNKEIFYAKDATDISRDFTKQFHPAPDRLHGYVLDLMARNSYQVLGYTMNIPSEFVLCYTKDGCEHHDDRTRDTGGTGQAISIASAYNLPIINMANEGWEDKLMRLVSV